MIDAFFEKEPFGFTKEEKYVLLSARLSELTRLHYANCPEYRAMLDALGFSPYGQVPYEQLPFLPVSLFKRLELRSVPQDEIVKVLTSSGTSGQAVSRIFLDGETARLQQQALAGIVSSFAGVRRMPMIIVDCPSVLRDREKLTARGAGILGFSVFGNKRIFALDDEMKLDFNGLKEFIAEHRGKKILLFGFTFMIWQHFYHALLELPPMSLDLSDAVLIHGGGWKKLLSEQVSPQEFKQELKRVCGITDIHDYYGMAEQTGSIFMECECGHLHASIFSDVLIRDPANLQVCPHGKRGIIQVLSALPQSYPGHSLLTEDEGTILGEDDCPCGRKGKYFIVYGRLKNAEIRGCSDTYAADF